jgi:hypothetical protein
MKNVGKFLSRHQFDVTWLGKTLTYILVENINKILFWKEPLLVL